MSLMMRLRLAQDGATHPCPQQRSAQFHLMALVQLWSSMMIYALCYHHEYYEDYDDENSVVLNMWCIPCYVQVLLMTDVPSSYFHLIHLNGLWGCLSVMCSWWWRCKESVEYIFLKWKLQKQYCLKHVLYPMLRGSHLIFDVSISYFHQTNVSSCYGWQYAYNLQHLPHVTTLKANS